MRRPKWKYSYFDRLKLVKPSSPTYVFSVNDITCFCRPAIDPIASIFDRMLCGRSEASTDGRGYTVGSTTLPGSDPIEATRRR